MQIRVTCPECGKSFLIPERFAGRDGECSNCSGVFHIPERAEHVSDAEMQRKSGVHPATPPGPAPAESLPARDAGVTEEIPVYSIGHSAPADEFETSEKPTARPEGADQSRPGSGQQTSRAKPRSSGSQRAAAASRESAVAPVFDITDADLLPDEEESASDDVSALTRALAAEADADGSGGDSASGDIVLKRGGGTGRTPKSGELPQPRRRKKPRSDDSTDDTPRRRSSAEIALPPKPLRRTRLPEGDSSSIELPGDAARAAVDSDDDAHSDSTDRTPPVPMLRRRISERERPHAATAAVSASAAASDSVTDRAVAEPGPDEAGCAEDRPSRRPARKSDPKQLAIVGGIGAVLLIGAGIYSHFSGGATPTQPVLEGGPTAATGGSSIRKSAQPGPTPVAGAEAAGRVADSGSGPASDRESATAEVVTAGNSSSSSGRASVAANSTNAGQTESPTTLAAAAPVPRFPELPEARPSAVEGIACYEIDLGSIAENAGPGATMRLLLYLPPGEHSVGSLSCVLVAPAGTSLLEGAECFNDSDRDETLPYVEAGFAVVGYSLDGALPFEQPTDGELNAAYRQFRAAQAGLLNARNALEFVLERVPQVAPDRIFAAGHSSAGTLSLLFASHEPRLAGCLAFAPLTDPETSLAEYVSSPAVQRIFPGVHEFVRFESPLRRVDRLHCPVFLFHAEDDATVPVAASRAFAEKLSATGTTPYLQTVASGGHRDAMLSEGIPSAIAWLKQQTENR